MYNTSEGVFANGKMFVLAANCKLLLLVSSRAALGLHVRSADSLAIKDMGI